MNKTFAALSLALLFLTACSPSDPNVCATHAQGTGIKLENPREGAVFRNGDSVTLSWNPIISRQETVNYLVTIERVSNRQRALGGETHVVQDTRLTIHARNDLVETIYFWRVQTTADCIRHESTSRAFAVTN